MITITTQGDWGLRARGHAGYAPHGRDIVCAAASVLLDTYACAARGMQARLRLRQAPGCMEIAVCDLPRKHRRELAAVRAAVLQGLARVAMTYPDHVRLETSQWKGEAYDTGDFQT